MVPISSTITTASPDSDYSIICAPEPHVLTPLSDCSELEEPKEPEGSIPNSSTTPGQAAPTILLNAAVWPDKHKHADTTASDENKTSRNTGAMQVKVPRLKKKEGKAKAIGAASIHRSGRGVQVEVQAAAAWLVCQDFCHFHISACHLSYLFCAFVSTLKLFGHVELINNMIVWGFFDCE